MKCLLISTLFNEVSCGLLWQTRRVSETEMGEMM